MSLIITPNLHTGIYLYIALMADRITRHYIKIIKEDQSITSFSSSLENRDFIERSK